MNELLEVVDASASQSQIDDSKDVRLEQTATPELVNLMEKLRRSSSPTMRLVFALLTGRFETPVAQLQKEAIARAEHTFPDFNTGEVLQSFGVVEVDGRQASNSTTLGKDPDDFCHMKMTSILEDSRLEKAIDLSDFTVDERRLFASVIKSIYTRRKKRYEKLAQQDDAAARRVHSALKQALVIFTRPLNRKSEYRRYTYHEARGVAHSMIQQLWPNGGEGSGNIDRDRKETALLLQALDQESPYFHNRPNLKREVEEKVMRLGAVVRFIEEQLLPLQYDLFKKELGLSAQGIVFIRNPERFRRTSFIPASQLERLYPKDFDRVQLTVKDSKMRIYDRYPGLHATVDGDPVLIFQAEMTRWASAVGVPFSQAAFRDYEETQNSFVKYSEYAEPVFDLLPETAGINQSTQMKNLSQVTPQQFDAYEQHDLVMQQYRYMFIFRNLLSKFRFKLERKEKDAVQKFLEAYQEVTEELSVIVSSPANMAVPDGCDQLSEVPERLNSSLWRLLRMIFTEQLREGVYKIESIPFGANLRLSEKVRSWSNAISKLTKRETHLLQFGYDAHENESLSEILLDVAGTLRSPSFILQAPSGDKALAEIDSVYSHNREIQCNFLPYALPTNHTENAKHLLRVTSAKIQSLESEGDRLLLKLWLPKDVELETIALTLVGRNQTKTVLTYGQDYLLEKSQPYGYYQAVITKVASAKIEFQAGILMDAEVSIAQSMDLPALTIDQPDQLTRLQDFAISLRGGGYTKLAERLRCLITREEVGKNPITSDDLRKAITQSTYGFTTPKTPFQVLEEAGQAGSNRPDIPSLPPPSSDGELVAQCAHASVLLAALLNHVFLDQGAFSHVTVMKSLAVGFGARLVGIPHAEMRGVASSGSVHHDPTPAISLRSFLSVLDKTDRAARKLKKTNSDQNEATPWELKKQGIQEQDFLGAITSLWERVQEAIDFIEETQHNNSKQNMVKEKQTYPSALVQVGALFDLLMTELKNGAVLSETARRHAYAQARSSLADWALVERGVQMMIAASPAERERSRRAMQKLFGEYVGLSPTVSQVLKDLLEVLKQNKK